MRQYSDYSFEFHKITVKWREAKNLLSNVLNF